MSDIILKIANSTEFWSTIAGAIVGGGIAFCIQYFALRETRVIREDDRKIQREALANSLMFKVIRIYSNLHGIVLHFEESQEQATTEGMQGEPWQIYVQLANLPDVVSFTSGEMAMLLSLKADAVFNSVLDLDVRHNAIISILHTFNGAKKDLEDRIAAVGRVEAEQGRELQQAMPMDAWHANRPRMINVNGLAEDLISTAKKDFEIAGAVLQNLHQTLRDKCGLSYTIALKNKKANVPLESAGG